MTARYLLARSKGCPDNILARFCFSPQRPRRILVEVGLQPAAGPLRWLVQVAREGLESHSRSTKELVHCSAVATLLQSFWRDPRR